MIIFGPDPYDDPDYDDSWDEGWDGSPTSSVTRSDPFDEAEWAESWAYLAEENQRKRPVVRWDHMSHAWSCTCKTFSVKGNCYHVYRFRPEHTVKVDERYL